MAAPTKREVFQKEDVVRALVITDSFDSNFQALTPEAPTVLLPLVNIPILEYTLEFLSAAGVQEVILFCCSHADRIKEYIRKSKWNENKSQMQITFVISEDALSLGDALRDIYDKRILVDDFILLTGDIVSNIQLRPILDLHKERRKKCKSTVMTAVYKRGAPCQRIFDHENSSLIVYNQETNQILHNQQLENKRKLPIPMDILTGKNKVTIARDLLDCHISICSPDVLSLFADNFDYQTRFDFIKGILEHEEILGNLIYLYITDNYAAKISNMKAYRAVSLDIINRWVFPIVPDLLQTQIKCSHLQHNVYKDTDVTLARSCTLEENVVIGSGTKIGSNTTISDSVIGRNCILGDNVYVSNAFVWDNVTIEDGSKVEMAVLASNVVVGAKANVLRSILAHNVHVALESDVKDSTLTASHDEKSTSKDDTDDVDSGSDEELDKDPFDLAVHPAEEEYYSSECGSYEDELGDRESPHLDDTNVFYREVLDTLVRGIQEKLKCDNLILEINSLKYIYNMTVSEVNHLMTKAILELPTTLSKKAFTSKEYLSEIQPLFTRLLPLIKNYIKNHDSQMDFLNAHKEYAASNENLQTTLVNILHFLYDQEAIQEEVLLSWFNSLDENNAADSGIKKKVLPLINWLNEAEEESD